MNKNKFQNLFFVVICFWLIFPTTSQAEYTQVEALAVRLEKKIEAMDAEREKLKQEIEYLKSRKTYGQETMKWMSYDVGKIMSINNWAIDLTRADDGRFFFRFTSDKGIPKKGKSKSCTVGRTAKPFMLGRNEGVITIICPTNQQAIIRWIPPKPEERTDSWNQ